MNQEEIKSEIMELIPKLVKTAVAAIIAEDNKILLERRNSYMEKNKWCLPGGLM